MTTLLSARAMEQRIAELEGKLAALAQDLRDANDRARRAERTAQEAWGFAKTIMRTGRMASKND